MNFENGMWDGETKEEGRLNLKQVDVTKMRGNVYN
jgi:hypothetical protein